MLVQNVIFIGVLDCMRYFGLENVNLEKSALSKMKRQCFGDSKNVFKSKIGQVVP
jgi:hypothetical protein